MDELDVMKKAKLYIDKLAQGVDPINNTTVPQNCIVNNVRLVRCFFYISDILRQVIENDGKIGSKKDDPKEDFNLTPEQKEKITYSEKPILITEFAAQINKVLDLFNMKKMPVTLVTKWLLEKGFLQEDVDVDSFGRKRKIPTQQGIDIGLSSERRQGRFREYTIILYDMNAQKFVIDNIDEMIAEYYNKEA